MPSTDRGHLPLSGQLKRWQGWCDPSLAQICRVQKAPQWVLYPHSNQKVCSPLLPPPLEGGHVGEGAGLGPFQPIFELWGAGATHPPPLGFVPQLGRSQLGA